VRDKRENMGVMSKEPSLSKWDLPRVERSAEGRVGAGASRCCATVGGEEFESEIGLQRSSSSIAKADVGTAAFHKPNISKLTSAGRAVGGDQ
jgi:hypothetical protein